MREENRHREGGQDEQTSSSFSQVGQVLADAQRDLQNAKFGPLEGLTRPLRDLVLQPTLRLASDALPPLTTRIPFADAFVAFGLSLPCTVMRRTYSIFRGHGDIVLSENERRRMLADERLVNFVAEEIKQNCDQVSTAELNEQFLKEQDGSFTFKNVLIDTPDGTVLQAVVMEPKVEDSSKLLPIVIFVNSWSATEHEYILLASKMAKKGYIVVCYCTRGFGKSGGLVNVAGEKDQEDMGALLDWVEANTQVDVKNIGITGISYGGGLSLLGAATQDRIKTAAALAGWGDLAGSLYADNTPRVIWSAFLMISGFLTGELDPVVKEKLTGLVLHENIDEILQWAAKRSAITYIDGINAKNKPIYMAQSFGDDLFNPNQAFRFFEKLTGPKRMDFSQGIHGTPEGFGLLGDPNYVWDHVFDWFDYHLKGEYNSIMDTQLTMELKLESTTRKEFSSWPSDEVFMKRFYLKSRGFFSNGTLAITPNGDDSSTTTISSSHVSSTAISGIPMVSPFFEAHFQQAIPALLSVNRFVSIVYYSEALESTLKIRGHVKLHLTVASSISKAHVCAYLYDDCGFGWSKLITHGVVSEHEITPNKEMSMVINIQATAYNVPAGHHLAIAIDTHDPLYAPPTNSFHKLTVYHSESVLELQCIN